MVAGDHRTAAFPTKGHTVKPHARYVFMTKNNPGVENSLCPGGPFDPIRDRAP